MKTTCIAIFACLVLPILTIDAQTEKPKSLKQFSLLVRVPEDYGSERAKSAGAKWDRLIEEWKQNGVYVISFAFPAESFTISGSEKTVRKEAVLSGNLRVVSNLVVKAENFEKALELAKACPVLDYGGVIEVREIPKPLQIN